MAGHRKGLYYVLHVYMCYMYMCILWINSAIHNGALGYAEHLFNSIWWPPNQSTSDNNSQFTMGHNGSLESCMNKKTRKQKTENKDVLENFQFQHISIFWEYVDDIFSFDAFSERKIYSWRERTLLNSLHSVHIHVLFFNLENTCK